jgi:hypothetical protein
MPLEGHYQRVNTPLRKLQGREIKVLVIGLVVTLAVCLGLLFLPSSSHNSFIQGANEPGSGCIEVGVAGRVGNEPVLGCGAKAEAICARAAGFDDPRAHTISAACEHAGVKF